MSPATPEPGAPAAAPLPRAGDLVRRCFVGVILAGAAWRVLRYALGFPIWGDEAFVAVNFIVRDFRGLFEPLVYGQIVPLGFSWLELLAARTLGLSEWALRLVPFLAGLASLALFAWFARRFVGGPPAWLAAGIFAVSYYPVRHAAEVKPYALDLLVSLLLTIIGWRLLSDLRRRRLWAALLVALALAPWLSYPSLFVAVSLALLLAWRAWRHGAGERCRPPAAAALVVLGLSGGLMVLTYALPHAAAAPRLKQIEMWTQAFPPLHEPWNLPLWLLVIHTGNMLAYPLGGTTFGSAGTLALVIIGTVWVARRRAEEAWLLLGPLVPALAAAAARLYPYGGSARTMLYMAPAFCLLAGIGLWELLRRLPQRGPATAASESAPSPAPAPETSVSAALRRLPQHGPLAGLTLVAAAFLIIALVGAARDVREPYKSPAAYRSRQAVRTLARETAPTDRWVVFNADREVPYAPNLRDWGGVGGQFVFDVLRYAPVPLTWAPPPDELTVPPDGRLWVLLYRADNPKVAFPDELWTAYRATLTARLGPAQRWFFNVKDETDRRGRTKKESVEAYAFGGYSSAAGGGAAEERTRTPATTTTATTEITAERP